MCRFNIKRFRKITYLFCLLALLSSCLTVQATAEDTAQRLEQQRAMTIQSNQVPNWPTGPVVGAESAILMEMETGTILYEKNIHLRQYPASTDDPNNPNSQHATAATLWIHTPGGEDLPQIQFTTEEP